MADSGVTYDQICGASYFSYFWKLLGQRMVRCETVVRLDRLPPQNIPSFQKRGRGNVLSRQSRQLSRLLMLPSNSSETSSVFLKRECILACPKIRFCPLIP